MVATAIVDGYILIYEIIEAYYVPWAPKVLSSGSIQPRRTVNFKRHCYLQTHTKNTYFSLVKVKVIFGSNYKAGFVSWVLQEIVKIHSYAAAAQLALC